MRARAACRHAVPLRDIGGFSTEASTPLSPAAFVRTPSRAHRWHDVELNGASIAERSERNLDAPRSNVLARLARQTRERNIVFFSSYHLV